MNLSKYLFDEQKQTPEGMVSVSQLQTYLSCRKKWAYGYIENLTPRVERAYLSIGKLCHKGMQMAMQSKWEWPHNDWGWWREQGVKAIREEWDAYINSVPLLDEELPDMEKMLTDATEVFCQAFAEFEPWKYEVLTICRGKKLVPALELHFQVPCKPTKGLHGFIDAILIDKTTGFTWCTDYKFRKSLSPDDDEAFNIQNSVYAYACKKMGIEITGTMTWQHVNTPAAEPQLLKNGSVSRSKIKTTWDRYAQFCVANGVNPELYREEMEPKLAEIEWFRATYEYRNPETIDRIWDECVLPAARSVKAAHGKNAANFRSLYPWNCKMCQYQSLCQGELRGYDADHIRLAEYVVRSHARVDNKVLDDDVAPVV